MLHWIQRRIEILIKWSQNHLTKKQFTVNIRYVGNSYAVSIPREIVNFMNEQETIMNNMVKLCMEEFGRVSLNFVPSNKEKLI